MAGISPSLPFRRDADNGFALTQTMLDVIKQNLKNLVLTNPGERIMMPEFGVGIKTFLFELNNSNTQGAIQSAIVTQAKKYMPFINVENVIFNVDEFNAPESLQVTLLYNVQSLELSDELQLLITS